MHLCALDQTRKRYARTSVTTSPLHHNSLTQPIGAGASRCLGQSEHVELATAVAGPRPFHSAANIGLIENILSRHLWFVSSARRVNVKERRRTTLRCRTNNGLPFFYAINHFWPSLSHVQNFSLSRVYAGHTTNTLASLAVEWIRFDASIGGRIEHRRSRPTQDRSIYPHVWSKVRLFRQVSSTAAFVRANTLPRPDPCASIREIDLVFSKRNRFQFLRAELRPP